jgi:hypothetical protein
MRVPQREPLLPLLIAAEDAALDFLKRTWDSNVNRCENPWNIGLDNWPVIRREGYDRQSTARKVLLINKASIARYEDVKAVIFRRPQQFTVP